MDANVKTELTVLDLSTRLGAANAFVLKISTSIEGYLVNFGFPGQSVSSIDKGDPGRLSCYLKCKLKRGLMVKSLSRSLYSRCIC